MLFFVLNLFGARDALSSVVNTVFEPMRSVGFFSGRAFAQKTNIFMRVWAMQSENTELHKKLNVAYAALAEQETVIRDNDQLREALNLPERSTSDLVAADVTGRDHFGRSWIRINRGQEHGVATGDVALTLAGVLVGRIVEVASNDARVELITSIDSSLIGVNARDERPVALVGAHDLNVEIRRIPKDMEVLPGDVFFARYTDLSGVPRLYPVITVQGVLESNDRLTRTASGSTLYDYERLNHVSILPQ